MSNNKYKFLICDFSYIISRNLFSLSKNKEVGEYTYGELIRMTIWTMNKLARDYGLTADKVILIYDKWDKNLGGYYSTYLLGGKYKDTREYMTEELLDQYKSDPNKTPEEIHDAELKLYQNQVKYKAKWTMISELSNYGLPCLGIDGWEADSLGYLASCMLYNKYDKPSVLVTKDSDWTYALSPATEYFRIPTGKSEPKLITYDEMYYQIPEKIRNKGLGLYEYKAYLDSLGEGHNDMRVTKVPYANVEDTILKILDGDFSNVSDVDLFNKQLSTFDISKFPRFEEAKRLITDIVPTCGKLGSILDFHSFCDKHGISGVSDKYYNEFISRFDEKLYCER